MKQGLQFFCKQPGFTLLIGAVLGGAFSRGYNFSEWLLFKGDAFRDAVLASNVYRVGWESLPLLGPRAGGTMLHLGPIFYYFQAMVAWLFQSVDAPVLAYPDLVFSILTLPLFFFFARRYFSGLWSGVLTLMLATSFLAIEYGRFGWNPNSTLFFTLLFSMAILNVYESDTLPGTEKKRAWWALIGGFALAIASQLHFSAFLGLPLLLLAFGLWHVRETRRVLTPRVVVLFLLGVFIIYLPVVFSEYLKHGENTGQFFAALASKSSGQGIVQNVIVVAIVFAKYFLRIWLGIIESGRTLIVLAGLGGLVGFLANVLLLRTETDQKKQHFLQWTLLLPLVYFFLYIPLADKIDRPRFFLPLLAVPYLFFGYVMVWLRQRCATLVMSVLATLGVVIIVGSNVSAVTQWFSELEAAQHMTAVTESRNSKGKSFLLTWGHFERVAAAMVATCPKEQPIIFVMAKQIEEYGHSVEYALQQQGSAPLFVAEKFFRTASPAGCYFFVSLPGETIPALVTDASPASPLSAGGIQALRFSPLQATLPFVPDEAKETVFVPEKITRNSRVYWGDVVNLLRK